MGQIREANEVYEQATIRKRDELIRLSEAKKVADLLYEKIAKTEGKIMRREKKYEEVKKTMEQQQKINAANKILNSNEKRFSEKVAKVEKDLYSGKKILFDWQDELRHVLTNYKSKCNQLHNIQRRQEAHKTHISALQNNLKEMRARMKILVGKKEFRQPKIQVILEEMKSLEKMQNDGEVRAMLAEQEVVSLQTFHETLSEEYHQQHISLLDLKDQVEKARRRKNNLMRKLNISHPMQFVR